MNGPEQREAQEMATKSKRIKHKATRLASRDVREHGLDRETRPCSSSAGRDLVSWIELMVRSSMWWSK